MIKNKEGKEQMSYSFDDTANKCGIGTFLGFVKHSEFKKVAEELLEILKTKKYTKQINDVSLMDVLETETQEYLATHWFPKAKLYGLKHFAFITSTLFYGNMSEKRANKDAAAKFGIEIKHFITKEEAINWLNSISANK